MGLSEEMTSVTADLMKEQSKRNGIESDLKLSKERELVLSVENNSLKLSNAGYQKRQDELLELEKATKREIIALKGRWEKLLEKEKLTAKETDVKIKLLEENIAFYKDQEKVFVYGNEILKEELTKVKESEEYLTAKLTHLEKQNEDFKKNIELLQNELEASKILQEANTNEQENEGGGDDKSKKLDEMTAKCNTVQSELEDVQNRLDKLSAQMRRKDWEIENYQKKIDEIQYANEVKVETGPKQDETRSLPKDKIKTESHPRDDQIKAGPSSGSSCEAPGGAPIKVELDDDVPPQNVAREVNNNKDSAGQETEEGPPPAKKPRLPGQVVE